MEDDRKSSQPLAGPFEDKYVTIDYTNHAGVRQLRQIHPGPIRFDSSTWHPVEQWLLDAYDVGKDDARTFALASIHGWYPTGDRQTSIDLSLAKQLQASLERNSRMMVRMQKLANTAIRFDDGAAKAAFEAIMKDEEPTW